MQGLNTQKSGGGVFTLSYRQLKSEPTPQTVHGPVSKLSLEVRLSSQISGKCLQILPQGHMESDISLQHPTPRLILWF